MAAAKSAHDRQTGSRRRGAFLPRLEGLEDRTVLAQMTGIDYSAILADPKAFDPTRIIVRFNTDARAGEVAQQVLPGSQLGEPIALVPGARSVRLPAGVTVRDALARFQSSPFVRYAEPNGYWRIAETIPNDARFGELYGMRNTGQGGGTPGADVKATFAWDVSTGGTSVLIANIDTGIDYDHPDLYLNIWVNQGEIPAGRLANLTDIDGDGLITFWDLNDPSNQGPGKITDQNGDGRISASDILRPMSGELGGWADSSDGDGNGRTDDLVGWNFAATSNNNPADDFGHGTHTAGTHSALGNNAIGVAGVTWKSQIAIVKFLNSGGGGTWEDSALAVSYAVQIGARLSTNSWGGTQDAQVLRDAISAARNAGHLFVAAAGNNGQDIDGGGFFPAGYSADLDNVLTVAATDRQDQKPIFSNFGRNRVHLGAPGVEILSTVPTRSCALCDPSGYKLLDGTSMATPHVAGAALLVWNLNPGWDYLQVKEQLLLNVDEIPSMQGRTVTGGRLNVDKAIGFIAAGPRVRLSSPNQSVIGPVSSLRITFDRPIDVSTFTVDDVRSLTGPGGAIKVAGVEVVPGTGDTQFDIRFADQGTTGLYQIEIGPDVRDTKGTQMDQNRNGVVGEDPDDRFAGRFGVRGPQVTSQTPGGSFFEAASSVRVTFNVPMDPKSFSLDDVVSFTGPGGAIPIKSVAVVPDTDNRQFELTFAEQSAYGQYTLVIGPDIQDLFGNPMDQNNNLTPGEVPGDRYTGSFRILDPCVGPDSVGHYGCGAYWEDHSILGLTGTFTILPAMDDGFQMVDLRGNTFHFYGTTYTGTNRMFVNSNGLITFGSGTAEYVNGPLTNSPSQAALAVFWDDLIKASGPMVLGRFEDLDGDGTDDRLVIEWNQVLHYPSSPRAITFQAHLYLNTGTETYFTYNYFDLDTGDATSLGASAAIGIKDAGTQGSRRLLISNDALSPYVQSFGALTFYRAGTGPAPGDEAFRLAGPIDAIPVLATPRATVPRFDLVLQPGSRLGRPTDDLVAPGELAQAYAADAAVVEAVSTAPTHRAGLWNDLFDIQGWLS